MLTVVLQAADGITLDFTTALAIASPVLGTLVAAIAALWRQSVAESKRKDELIDRLLALGLEDADTTRRSVSLLEKERRRP